MFAINICVCTLIMTRNENKTKVSGVGQLQEIFECEVEKYLIEWWTVLTHRPAHGTVTLPSHWMTVSLVLTQTRAGAVGSMST